MSTIIYKKPVITLIIILSLALSTSAQIQYGIKGGLNFSEIMTSGNPVTLVSGNNQTLRYFPITSVHGGIFALIPLSKKWYFQPELLYSLQGATGKPEMDYLISATENYRFGYLNIPLLVKYKLPAGFFVQTGPQLGLLLSAKIDETVVGETSDIHYNIKSQLKSTDLSWAFGAGYCSPFNIGFDFRYNLGLTNYNQATEEGRTSNPIPNGTMKNSVFQFGIFYIFGKKLFNPPQVSE